MVSPEKKREYMRRWQAKNPGYAKAWREAHKVEISESNRQWREKNPGYAKAWREANRERCQEVQRKYREAHRERMANDPEYRAAIHERDRVYREANRERRKEYMRKYREKNGERLRSLQKAWYAKNKAKAHKSVRDCKNRNRKKLYTIQAVLYDLRMQLGWRQIDAAKHFGVTQTTWSNWELGYFRCDVERITSEMEAMLNGGVQ